MILFVRNNHLCMGCVVWSCFLLLMTITYIDSQHIFIANFVQSTSGTQFVPIIASAQLISTTLVNSVKKCMIACTNNVLCRIYDYEVFGFQQCRLFEGDTSTLGQIVSSPSSRSLTGTIRLSPKFFTEYGSPCSSFCYHSRYLQCGSNFTCECMPHTYWDTTSSMCVPQSPILGAPCEQNKNMCREDLNYTCLQFNQCGPLSLLEGTSILHNSSVIGPSWTPGVSNPSGITIFGTKADSFILSDAGNNRVLGLWNIDTIYQNISVIATEWTPGRSLNAPRNVYLDLRNRSNLYVSDVGREIVVLYTNMQSINPLPRIVAGTNDSSATGLYRLNIPYGVQVDSRNNVLVASSNDHYIVLWPPNATSGIVIAGLGTPSNASTGLNAPYGILLDEENSWLYVADTGNHRIQRYSLNDTWPRSGTTVAGGNGLGSGSHQLSSPVDIYISKKTGAMYIVDKNNHRIQRWQQGATQGVTIAGSPTGAFGSSPTKLRNPAVVALNVNETYMYVVDRGNNRVQRFQLI